MIFNHPILLRHGGILIPLMAIVLLVSLPGRFRPTALLCLYAPGVSIVFWGVLRPDPESWTDIAIMGQMTVLAYITGAILRQRLNRMRREQFLHIRRERSINQTLLEAKEAAEQGSRVKAEFLAVMSHEIRTPMTGVLGMMRLVLDSPLSPQDRRRLQLAHQSGEGLLGILDDILDMSRLEAGAVTFAAAPFSLSDTIQDVVALCALQAEAKGLTLDLALCDGTPDWGIGDAARLRQVLFNLVGNAIKFTEQGHIHITANAEQTPAGTPGVVLTVTDSGIGIAPEQREHIFGLFGQADASIQRRFGGTGLGLTICKRLVEGMGGQINFASTPGHGSAFSVHLPFTSAEKPKAIKAPASTHQQHRSLSLLVADDQEVNSEVAKAYLCAAGHQVTTVRNGAEALAQVQAQGFDLVLMDMRMPVMDGFQFCEELKNDESISHIPVILLTALSGNENKIKGYKLGADGYLVKPFDPSLLKSRIDNIVKARAELKGKFSEDVDSDVNVLTHSPIDEEFMTKLTGFIENKMSEPELTASLLCLEMGMSSSKLYRKVKELTDLAPNEFIRTIRLKKSAYLLKSKRHNVSEVATLVGFNDPLYFSRCFKKQFGFPPSNLLQ